MTRKNLTEIEAAQQTKITGGDETYQVDVQLVDGHPSLRTFGVQAIESLRGFDPIPDVWFYIGSEEDDDGTVGAENDTIRVQIAAGSDASLYPAIDITYTLTASDAANDEDSLATNVAAYLNADNTFSSLWRAQKITGSGCVYITARKPGGHYERPNTNDFMVSSTGTVTVTAAFDKIIRQNKITSLARDPADPRQGILGIQGSVVQTEGDVTNRFQTVFDNLLVDGSVTPVDFTISADPTEVVFVSSITFSGQGNGIKFGQFLSKNTVLTNGILITFKSNDFMASRAALKTTNDFAALHAGDPSRFSLYIQSGGDYFQATLEFGSPLEIRPQGEFSLDDYLTISVQDNLTSGISVLRCIVEGFNREY